MEGKCGLSRWRTYCVLCRFLLRTSRGYNCKQETFSVLLLSLRLFPLSFTTGIEFFSRQVKTQSFIKLERVNDVVKKKVSSQFKFQTTPCLSDYSTYFLHQHSLSNSPQTENTVRACQSDCALLTLMHICTITILFYHWLKHLKTLSITSLSESCLLTRTFEGRSLSLNSTHYRC